MNGEPSTSPVAAAAATTATTTVDNDAADVPFVHDQPSTHWAVRYAAGVSPQRLTMIIKGIPLAAARELACRLNAHPAERAQLLRFAAAQRGMATTVVGQMDKDEPCVVLRSDDC